MSKKNDRTPAEIAKDISAFPLPPSPSEPKDPMRPEPDRDFHNRLQEILFINDRTVSGGKIRNPLEEFDDRLRDATVYIEQLCNTLNNLKSGKKPTPLNTEVIRLAPQLLQLLAERAEAQITGLSASAGTLVIGLDPHEGDSIRMPMQQEITHLRQEATHFRQTLPTLFEELQTALAREIDGRGGGRRF